MDDYIINALMQKYKGKIKNVGIQSDEIKQIKLIIKNGYSDDERLFTVEGIWAHQKILYAKLNIETFLFCPEYVYSNEAVLLVDLFIDKAEKVYTVSQRFFKSP